MDERLEIIKDKQLQMHALSTFDINWLIQQAEKVQELEKENKELKEAGKFFADGYHQYEQENQRYKEDLEEIRNEASSYMGSPAASRVYDIADNSLRGESE